MKLEIRNENEFLAVDKACKLYSDLLQASKMEPPIAVSSKQRRPYLLRLRYSRRNISRGFKRIIKNTDESYILTTLYNETSLQSEIT